MDTFTLTFEDGSTQDLNTYSTPRALNTIWTSLSTKAMEHSRKLHSKLPKAEQTALSKEIDIAAKMWTYLIHSWNQERRISQFC